ncbi:hypothetical protein HYH03_006842 [Edaphochlamys debaryana]|uniref:Uncharacterized protein n=1 Tax=Edaphochlamys debaryana TaxID=47281 RepID=A0A836C0H1_9CHLO|nr:hypothetical protein HYH03_006842 [Edaphochlamys debaryana]|eukprot:KAG2494907.1 hypothetical protein HYH03_006842 [Edaphochlamys debaryana]
MPPPGATSGPRPSGVARRLLLAAWLVTASAGHWGRLADAADAADPAGLLKSCWNEHFNHMPSSFAGLYLADVFWSSHDSDLPLTIFTMASMDRLPMLEAQCQGWAGPLAAALYLPLITSGPPEPPPASGPPPTAEQSMQLPPPPAGSQPGAAPPPAGSQPGAAPAPQPAASAGEGHAGDGEGAEEHEEGHEDGHVGGDDEDNYEPEDEHDVQDEHDGDHVEHGDHEDHVDEDEDEDGAEEGAGAEAEGRGLPRFPLGEAERRGAAAESVVGVGSMQESTYQRLGWRRLVEEARAADAAEADALLARSAAGAGSGGGASAGAGSAGSALGPQALPGSATASSRRASRRRLLESGRARGSGGQAAAASMAWRRRLRELGGRVGAGGGGRRVLLDEAEDVALRSVTAHHRAVLAAARQQLKSFFDRMEAARLASNGTTCSLRVGLFVEVADAQLAAIMPTNALRNAAGLMAQTPLAAMLDVDLGTSASLNRLAADPEWVKSVTAQVSGPAGPGLGILPAFETAYYLDPDTSREVTSVALKESKRVAAAMYRARVIIVFHYGHCPHCHGPIRHEEWVRASSPYEVHHNRSFEPWGILSRFEDPGYDEVRAREGKAGTGGAERRGSACVPCAVNYREGERERGGEAALGAPVASALLAHSSCSGQLRFRGWCYDKIQHVDSMANLRRFRMMVLPDAWLVHRFHEKVAVAALAHASNRRPSKKKKKSKRRSRRPPPSPTPPPGAPGTALHIRTEEAKYALLKELTAPDGTLASAYRHYRARVDWLIRTQRGMDLGNATTLAPHGEAGAGPAGASGPGGGKGGWAQTHRNAQLMHCRGVLPWWRQEQGYA